MFITGGLLLVFAGLAALLLSYLDLLPNPLAVANDQPAEYERVVLYTVTPEKVVAAATMQRTLTASELPGIEAFTETAPQPAATNTPAPLPTFTNIPTTMPSETPTELPPVQPTQVLFDTKVNESDHAVMVFVPAGKFIMGSDASVDPYFWGAESPQHEVTLSDYWIYQTEVTNGMYQACVAAKACPLPKQKVSRTHKEYYGNSQFDHYPVIYVDWVSAQSYCRWAGGRLPTEAEWEKAARGDQDTRLFPWGSEPATAEQANFCDINCGEQLSDRDKNDGFAEVAPVGSFPAGASPYGALDMAGNVWEWVFDWFQPGYSAGPAVDPVGPASSKHRGIRGGSYGNPSAGIRAVQRDGMRPDLTLESVGFRCVVEGGK